MSGIEKLEDTTVRPQPCRLLTSAFGSCPPVTARLLLGVLRLLANVRLVVDLGTSGFRPRDGLMPYGELYELPMR